MNTIFEKKDAFIHVAVKPSIKDLLVDLTVIHDRSFANLIERFIIKEAMECGLIEQTKINKNQLDV